MFRKKSLLIIPLFFILCGFTNDWDTTDPIDHSKNSVWPAEIRQVKTDTAERLTDQLYGFASGETTKGVKSLRFIDQVSDPSTVTDVIQIYGKAVNSKTLLYLKDEDGNVQGLSTPIGVINQFAGSSAPAGWFICDGTAYSRTTYAGLFAVIGTTYGVGDGATTFNVPDLRDRHVEGKGTTLNTLGATGGATTHTHDAGSYAGPSHTHTFTTGGVNFGGGGTLTAGALDTAHYHTGTTDASGTGSVTGTSASASSYSPYIVLNYIIKY